MIHAHLKLNVHCTSLCICSGTPFVSVNRNNTLMFPDKYLEVTVCETKHELNMRGTCLFTTSPVSQME